MVECSGTGDCLLICLLTHLRQGLFHTGEIIMPKFMLTGTHGVRHTQWQGKVMHMRHCHSCAQEGVPSTLMMDGAREQVMGVRRRSSNPTVCSYVLETLDVVYLARN